MRAVGLAKRCWQGLPYLKKEFLRGLSVKTHSLWTTPSAYYLICTGRCNAHCVHCPQVRGRSPDAPELPRATLLRFLRESKDLSGSGFNISISGGEPLIYEPLFEALELAQKLGINVGLTTNGYLLTPDNIKRLVAADPFNINISLESVDPAINEKIRPSPGGTRRVLDAIDALLAEKKRARARFGLFVKPTVTELNYRSLPQMVRYFGKGGGVQINPQNFYLVKGAEAFWIQAPDAFAAVAEELVALRQEGYGLVPPPRALRDMVAYFRSPPTLRVQKSDPVSARACSIGFRNLCVNPSGSAFFCELLGPVGNLNEGSLREIWYGAVAKKKRRDGLHCRFDCQMTCRRPVSLWAKVKAFLRMNAYGAHTL